MKENDRKITFIFEGKQYEVDASAYNKKFIALKDGRILQVESWTETLPHQPKNITVLKGCNWENDAEALGMCVAILVE